MSYRILVINPGSTSTKIGVYEDEQLLFDKTLRHSAEDIAQFKTIAAQKDWRRDLVMRALREQGIDCQACVKACPEQLDPHTASIPECTKCGQCAEACPVGAISFRKRVGAAVTVPAGEAAPAVAAERRAADGVAPLDDLDFEEGPAV